MSETSHLAATLQQCARAGVHQLPAEGSEAVERAATGLGFALVRVDLAGCEDKAEFLRRMAAALRFPDWFGHNWDAFADCMADLGWLPADGYVIVLDHADRFGVAAEADFVTALEILEEAARDWAEEAVPMWVFVGLTADGIAHLRSL